MKFTRLPRGGVGISPISLFLAPCVSCITIAILAQAKRFDACCINLSCSHPPKVYPQGRLIVEGVIQSTPRARLPDLPGKVECVGTPIALSHTKACPRDVCPNPFATTISVKMNT